MVASGWGKEEIGSDCLMDMGFSSAMMKMSWNLIVVMDAHL